MTSLKFFCLSAMKFFLCWDSIISLNFWTLLRSSLAWNSSFLISAWHSARIRSFCRSEQSSNLCVFRRLAPDHLTSLRQLWVCFFSLRSPSWFVFAHSFDNWGWFFPRSSRTRTTTTDPQTSSSRSGWCFLDMYSIVRWCFSFSSSAVVHRNPCPPWGTVARRTVAVFRDSVRVFSRPLSLTWGRSSLGFALRFFLWRSRIRQWTPSPFWRSTQCYYCSSKLWKKCRRGWKRLKMNEEKRKLDGMESSKSKSNAHCMHGGDERRAQVKLEPRCGLQIMTTRTWLLDYAHMRSPVHQFTCWGSCALRGRCSGSWWSRCHWCRASCRSVSPRIRNTKCRVLSFWIL